MANWPTAAVHSTCRRHLTPLQERIRHTNRIKGLLAGQGITGFNPLHKDRRQLLDAARTGDGRPLPPQLKAEILREIELIAGDKLLP